MKVDAVILVGGQGTRLRPLTLFAPKPMLPTAGVPFLEHMLSRIREAGIVHVVLGTSYKASVFSDYFGDGSRLGLDIEYVVETEALGTGGGIRNVADKLRYDTVMVFNGDVVSGVDLCALYATHVANNADVTLHLVKVADPRAFGCVATGAKGEVLEFLEKTEDPPTNQINAGCYVFKREVLLAIPPDRVVSVERETFPNLLKAGAPVFGYVEESYWLDLGTPAAFVKGSADLVRGFAPTAALPGPVGDSLILPGAHVAKTALVFGGTTLGRDVTVGDEAVVEESVVFEGAQIDTGARVVRSIVGAGATIGAGAHVCDAVIGDRALIGAGCELRAGIRVWPGVEIPASGIRFSA
ncbi:sugar phosphate nucleotidyltransferase [Nakamurella antarctica]|uniref:sugar phosphate nucleotidyltransferase n=1 Tax=Nakamurella antarctica TaxID=1902245 RepID=UPI001EF037FA|nr:NDP-sugar synthase [Nakamurella antarctica]